MRRTYELLIEEHLENERQMLFLVGPRQVGKTTTSVDIASFRPRHYYFNCDIKNDRQLIVEGADAVADKMELNELRKQLPIVVFDELHKYRKWKTFLKGFFDKYGKKTQIIVTGSAKLDVYKADGDSLMGRYFLYRLHPLSVAEIIKPVLRETEIASKSQKISDKKFDDLFNFGGFPEPYLRHNARFYTKWKKLRSQQLFREDIRDLTRIQELGEIEILAQLLRDQVGRLVNYSNLANKINVTVGTIRRWIEALKSFYFCFTIQPWTKNISRSLIKEPKVYLWDWALIEDKGARVENFIASHLLKAVHFWTDRGFGDYKLHFLRDKEKREVDFLVSKNGKPWFLVEVKSSEEVGLSKSIYAYQELTKAPHAFQVALDMEYVEADCFAHSKPIIVPAKTFLSQLV